MLRECNRIVDVRNADIDDAGWETMCRDAQALGFDSMLTPDLGAAAPSRAQICARADVSLMIDLRLDPQSVPLRAPHSSAMSGVAPEVMEAWIAYLLQCMAAGVAGFRCRTPTALCPQDWHLLISSVRMQYPACRFMAWTPGVSSDQLAALSGLGFDATFLSLPWWDERATWLVDEHARLQSIAPVYAPIADPDRADDRDTMNEPSLRLARRLLIATVCACGVLLPSELVPLMARPQLLEMNARFTKRAHTRARLQNLTGTLSTATALYREDMGILINPDDTAGTSLDWSGLCARLPQGRTQLDAVQNADGNAISLHEGEISMAPGAALLFRASVPAAIHAAAPAKERRRSPATISPALRIAIENISPSVDHGGFSAKCVAGEAVRVQADILMDGHDQLAARVLWRAADETDWCSQPMVPLGNDRWAADIRPMRMGKVYYTVQAWRDTWATYCDQLEKKRAAGQNLSLELQEGRVLIESASKRAAHTDAALAAELTRLARDADIQALLDPATTLAMSEVDPHDYEASCAVVYPLMVERLEAVYASWYELFPRSYGATASEHGRCVDVIGRLPALRDMGFDVLYFPPIHPIGLTHRKGKNNALCAGPDDPGSPYAIGSTQGGHTAVHPELGSLEDFHVLVACAHSYGMEIALDFAIQCSPDHPWLEHHPEWFAWRADGSLRYAENPPKRYEDIVNPDFYSTGASTSRRMAMWRELRDIVVFWIEQGVHIFRVDNPHTKPLPFWEWLIAEVKAEYPDTLFLSEAFTRPKMMYRLAKLGFSQSYTYFIWRHGKQELTAYLTELSTPPVSDFFRPNFFVNTPDINPYFLQKSGRPGFLIRAALAATTSGLWGVYSGFELCEASAVPGREEYLDSEKYQLRERDWQRPVNIIREIAQFNRIRRTNPALQTHLGIRFHRIDDEQILFFSKSTPQRDNVVLVAISLDPYATRTGTLELPLWEWGLSDGAQVAMEDVFDDHHFILTGKYQRIELSPERPFLVWRIARPV